MANGRGIATADEQRAVSVSIDDRGVVRIHMIGATTPMSAISAEDLKCAVCCEVPPGEVHQCSRGHFLCLSCWNRMDRAPERLCGECRVPLPLSNRNLVAERAIQGLPQPPEQPNTPVRVANRGVPLTPFLQRSLAAAADDDDDDDNDEDDDEEEEDEDATRRTTGHGLRTSAQFENNSGSSSSSCGRRSRTSTPCKLCSTPSERCSRPSDCRAS